jgi:hypothetical protein
MGSGGVRVVWVGVVLGAVGESVVEGEAMSEHFRNWIGGVVSETRQYKYLGDRYTRPDIVGAHCRAILTPEGKCITGHNATMLVEFDSGERCVVLRRRLRKIG